MNIAIITSGYLPVPPTKGGAVENLIYNLITQNELQNNHHFTVYSVEDNDISQNDISQKFINTTIKFIRIPKYIKFIDFLIYFIVKYILQKKHLITYRYIFQRFYFLDSVGKMIHIQSHDRIILENNVIMFRALKYKNNFQKYKGKIYYHAHNEIGKTLGYDRYLNFTKKIISISDYISLQFQKIIENQNIEFFTLHNAVEEKIFLKKINKEEKDDIKNKLSLKEDAITFLFVGRLSEEKGIAELLEALSQISSDQYNLIIVGDSFYATHLKDTFASKLRLLSKRLTGKVIFTGFVAYESMPKYYQIADICLLPSTWNEPAALTVIECGLSGTPLISTRVGGIPEFAAKSALLLETKDLSQQLIKHIRFYMENPELLKKWKEEVENEQYKFNTVSDYYNGFIEALT